MSFLRTIATIALLSGASVAGASAQDLGRYTGFSVGQTRSQQVWSPSVDTSDRTGFLVNYYTDLPSPLGPLRVRLGTGYTQRGGLVGGDFEGEALSGETRSEWLALHLELKLAQSIGPMHVFAAAGPAYGLHLRTRQDAVLAQVLFEERPNSFSVTASGGVGIKVSADRVAELEVRWVEGLTTTRSGSFVRARDRSLEIMLRIGRVKAPG